MLLLIIHNSSQLLWLTNPKSLIDVIPESADGAKENLSKCHHLNPAHHKWLPLSYQWPIMWIVHPHWMHITQNHGFYPMHHIAKRPEPKLYSSDLQKQWASNGKNSPCVIISSSTPLMTKRFQSITKDPSEVYRVIIGWKWCWSQISSFLPRSHCIIIASVD